MSSATLEATVAAIIASGKGILAADESAGTIKKRFDSIGVESTESRRRDYREMLFTTQGAEKYISGVILYDETIRQTTTDGTPLVKLLQNMGIVPGVKVDMGLLPVAGKLSEKVTEGLDGLGKRLEEYKSLGARFAKWRAVYEIADRRPSARIIDINAQGLSRYAAICQQHGVVPIVEPEVLMDGDHSIGRCAEVTEQVLHEVFNSLFKEGVVLKGMLLKPNMVLAGKSCPVQAGPDEVATHTLAVFRRVVPAALPGILFLSGGQSDQQATANLNAMNAGTGHSPWALSFSYGRALQAPTLKVWAGLAANKALAQAAYLKRARLNSLAVLGKYSVQLEQAA